MCRHSGPGGQLCAWHRGLLFQRGGLSGAPFWCGAGRAYPGRPAAAVTAAALQPVGVAHGTPCEPGTATFPSRNGSSCARELPSANLPSACRSRDAIFFLPPVNARTSTPQRWCSPLGAFRVHMSQVRAVMAGERRQSRGMGISGYAEPSTAAECNTFSQLIAHKRCCGHAS